MIPDPAATDTIAPATPNGPPRLLLHIGLPKTGTTSIQHALDETKDLAQQSGWRFAESGRRDRHNHLQFVRTLGFARDMTKVGKGAHRTAMELLAEAHEHRSLMVSHEALTRHPELTDEQTEFVEALLANFSTTVVMYLRRQDAWFESLYAQFVKRGREPRSADEAAEDFGSPYFGFCTDFFETYDFYSELVGDSGDIVIREFDRSKLVGADAVTDFFSLIGAEPAPTVADLSQNASLTPIAVETLRKVAEHEQLREKLTPREMEYIGRTFARMADTKGGSLLSPAARDRILQLASEQNARIGIDLLS